MQERFTVPCAALELNNALNVEVPATKLSGRRFRFKTSGIC
jgi:hypothetical protein